ncbi:MAG: transporter substrate-binding domain-containing protein [Dactylosporangium sp.]|nr:transporter substrate-binding domain-containing protein [Dactylosporangium sp.]NNJ61123.1 transporter substrate-binding domain-containing protein [Dactylosporangium sp.]
MDAGAVLRMARFFAVVTVMLGMAGGGILAVVNLGPPAEGELFRSSGIAGKRELLIGVKEDQPGIGLFDQQAGVYVGFDIEIAKMVAAELHFPAERVRFLGIQGEDRARMHAKDETGRTVKVDLVVASYSITDRREGQIGVSFAGPYLVTERSVITMANHVPVESLADLRGKSVCTLGTSTSEGPLAEAGLLITLKLNISECVSAMKRGEVEAVSLDSAVLAGFVQRDHPALVNHDIASEADERWGINTGGNEALRTLVNLALERSRVCPGERTWEDAFERYLKQAERYVTTQAVAEATQPEVDQKPKVREWPWQKALCE